VIIIGGGASGMMAAAAAAREGKSVTLIEKNDRLGKKLFITGKGRCNLTNASDIDEMIDNIPGNGNFLYSAFYTFSSYDLIDLMEKLGLKLKVERGNRVFPQSDKSSDVIKTFSHLLERLNVKILLNTTVDDIIIKEGRVLGVVCGGSELFCDSLIIATGGASYPLTGSTGDGYRFAEKAGHSIVGIRPSLVPLVTEEEWVKDLQGLSLKNISIRVLYNSKKIYEDFGEMIFTHFGISGPVILSSSRFIVDYLPHKVNVEINLKPGLSLQQLDLRLQRDFSKYSRKQFKNSLDDLLPQKIIPVVIRLCGIDGEKEVNKINRDERQKLCSLLQNLVVTVKDTRPINEAIITAGGVSTKEIEPSTMESKIIKGLYFSGEVIDADGLTGGFNLQIAFSTGYCAGINC
jgi:predicted Rossmann fold flavoprotein